MAGSAASGDQGVLRRILGRTEVLLLDFDGPICSVFAGIPASAVADQLRNVLTEGGHSDLPADVLRTDDPFDVFKYAATLGEDEARYTEAALRAHEVEAVATAEPTVSAHHLIQSWHATGRQLAVVSNNSVAAVQSYLGLHRLGKFIQSIAARSSWNPAQLKPNSWLVGQAVDNLGGRPHECTLVGDSPADMHAARSADVHTIGFANKPGKRSLLATAGAEALVAEMSEVVAAMQAG